MAESRNVSNACERLEERYSSVVRSFEPGSWITPFSAFTSEVTEWIAAEGVTYVTVVEFGRLNLKIDVHRQSKVLLEPDSREVDDTANLSFCFILRPFLVHEAFFNPDVKLGCCRPGEGALPTFTTGLGRLRWRWCICFCAVREGDSFCWVKQERLAMLVKEEDDDPTGDEPAFDLNGRLAILAAVHLDLGFKVALQGSVKEALICYAIVFCSMDLEEDLVLGSVSEDDLHVRKLFPVVVSILQPLDLDVTLFLGGGQAGAEKIEQDGDDCHPHHLGPQIFPLR